MSSTPPPAVPALRRRHATASRRLATVSAPLLALAAACAEAPVTWEEGEGRRTALPVAAAGVPDSAAADALLRAVVRTAVRTAAGVAVGAAADVAPPPAARPADLRGRMCESSLQLAAGRDRERYAAWWSATEEGRVSLVAARSEDAGATWSATVPVDTVDVAMRGCARPAPALAIDATNGFVHVAYSLRGPEGGGVFYAHRMDPRAPFEPPRVIVYGTDELVSVSVASQGDTVVVAYEDPNVSGRPAVSLALSRTGGHSFDERLRVSGEGSAAQRPVIALRNQTVVVGWLTRPVTATDNVRTAPLSAAVVRVGRLR
jgi:hypothetical protein